MKTFYSLLLLICISLGALAQKGKVTSALSFIEQGALDKAKDALEQAYVHEKSKDWFNTYFAKGKFCQAVYQANDPKYNSYCTDPLGEAYAAYEKAISMDPKGSVKKRIITNMIYNSLALDLYSQGSDRFEANDYAGALKSFATQIEITESDKYAGAVDTGMYYNAGLAAINSKQYNDAIKYFQKCADMHYLGITPHIQVYESYMGLGDTIKAESYLLDLPNKFPGDNQVILQLIDFYLKADKPDQAQKYITMAKEADPDNYSLYFAAGIMYLNQNNFDEAIAELTRSIELKNDLYDTQYGLGAAYINKAADMFLKANDIMDVNEYTQAVEAANSVYAKALPYMEKALELKPDDVYALRSLQELYYRLRQKDPSLNAKYEQTRARLSELEQ
ncbi:MAG TPA: tetratricopeptide repeat protein [Bacteroidales bacterium]|jgi:tetratricopeptide (TPR) repeat protein|nr:tetratricopeptide repeat protein [Bacteroidales bacterium]HOS71086.1 tetratricopeptide repeat protein [Bacteroidales bacterium]HQH25646.1 tetratricopeptide repeat protein [Bacteroidales bacterium]HQJ83234.1 tetratricopeptide repeat protein [Bacteroidales bacterium]